MNTSIQRILISMLLAGSATLTSANSAIKKQIEQEGFEFIQQIPVRGVTKPNSIFHR